MHTDEILVLECLRLLLAGKESLGEQPILLGQVYHPWIRNIVTAILLLQNLAQI